MSRITDCLLSFSCLEECDSDDEFLILADVNKFFTTQYGFVSIHDKRLPRGWTGGGKVFTSPLFIGAFNHIDVEKLINHLRSLPFNYPLEVQLIYAEEEGGFIIYNLMGNWQ